MDRKIILLFWGLTVSIFLFLFAPNLLREGMFVDGIWYAAISNNLSQGIGSFWAPLFTETIHNPFYEHPPLVFGLQSLLFSFFGEGFWTERIYCFLIFLLTSRLMVSIWNHVFIDNPTIRRLSFLPLLLWMVNFGVFFAYPNNVLECTMTLFLLLSFLFCIKALQNGKLYLLFLFASSVMIVLAFLSKGPVSLFPIIIFFAVAITSKSKKKKYLFLGSIHVLLIGLMIGSLFLFQDARINLLNYFDNQVISALSGQRTENMRAHRWYIILGLLKSMPVSIGVALLIFILGPKKNVTLPEKPKNWALVFLVLGLAGSFPLLISLKQAGYYLIPSIPCYIIAISIFAAPYLDAIIVRHSNSKLFINGLGIVVVCSLCVGGFLALRSLGKVDKRDKELLSFVKNCSGIVEKGKNIGVATHNFEHSLHGFFQRYHLVGLDTIKGNLKNYPYIITQKIVPLEIKGDSIPMGHANFRLIKTSVPLR